MFEQLFMSQVDTMQSDLYSLDMDSRQEQILVEQARDGCEQSFADLVRANMPAMVRLACSMVGNQADAEEIAQEAFVRLHRSLARFRGDSRISTWLYRTVTRLCIDSLRREKLRSRLFLFRRNEEDHDPLLDVEDTTGTPAEQLEARQTATVLAAAMSRLPAQQKAVLVLRQQQGLPIREIARIMQLSEGSIKTHLHRAVKALRSAITESEVPDHEAE